MPDVLARRLSGEGLAHSGRSEEIDDESLALATHKVIEARVGVVRLDERA